MSVNRERSGLGLLALQILVVGHLPVNELAVGGKVKDAVADGLDELMVMWLVVAVCAAALGLVTEEWKPITGTQWLGILWLGVVIDAVAYLLWALSLKDVGNTAKIANLAYLTPFLSLIISAVTFKNGIEPNEVIALVFIVGGILLQSFWDTLRRNA